MNYSRFEYILNAIHYCIWRGDIKSGIVIDKVIHALLSPIPKYLFTKEYKKKYHERLPREKKLLDKYLYDKENGFYIGRANSTFGFLYTGYPGLFSFILGGLWYRFFEYKYPLLNAILFGIPIGIGYIPAYRAVFTKDKYLKYHKKFKKKDASWHKKWKWITIAFFIGSWIMLAIGVAAMWGILLF
ncbi:MULTISPECIES: hypothetical protein [Segatella]|uniref:Uncharacterized protein n=2 Tax=Segatella TaxID=2974251 RepID=D8E0L3_9BACT|nr:MULTISPECIES: hypothetical protein [Segatella]EFI70802.1 hypothetical protein PBR_0838 [Segatella baroniae B14]UKK79843.1 hypothetical protein L6469_11860 [Segatella baroniae B14]GJG28633.1 hypothetical protein PRRU23_23330 [Segatella bryantii]SEQ16231.1 hypothetical protein SAMN05444375_10634 [Segatella baroniae B14]